MKTKTGKRRRVIQVDGPDPTREDMIPLAPAIDGTNRGHTAVSVLTARGVPTSKSSVFRWANGGMAVGGRRGPLVRLPTLFWSNRRQTSVQALTRFLEAVREAGG